MNTEYNDTCSETPVNDYIPLEADNSTSQSSRRHVTELANEGDHQAQLSHEHPLRHRYDLRARSICKSPIVMYSLLVVMTALTISAVEHRHALFDKIVGRNSYLAREFYSPGDSRLLPLSVWVSMFHSSIDLELTGDKFTA